jgi:hypothetical protein
MKLHEYIEKNQAEMKRLARAGIISGHVLRAYDVYKAWKKAGANYDAVIKVADDMRISDRTVWRYIRLMKSEM